MTDRVQRHGSSAFIAALGFLLIALAIGYYFVIALPAQGKERTRLAAALELEAMQQFSSCLSAAYAAYDASWERTCQQEGKGKECPLPTARAEALHQRYTQAQELCVKKYK